jgi:hypothetical protein
MFTSTSKALAVSLLAVEEAALAVEAEVGDVLKYK